MQQLINRLSELFDSNEIVRVVGWKKGETAYDPSPAIFSSKDELKDFVYDGFCGANLSKMMIEVSKLEGKSAVLLKPCDTYSFNQLIKEHRVIRDNCYIIGVGCRGKLDINKIKSDEIKNIRAISDTSLEGPDEIIVTTSKAEKTINYKDVLLDRCHVCKGKEHMISDEIIGESKDTHDKDKFEEIEALEKMSSKERFEFFRKELSKCIRCNACRNVCPACSCRKCVFDNNNFDSQQKVNASSFEENMFHIIRAYHVAGRCTDCGECSRVCPQGIPLHLFNRKFMKDINEIYGEYQAGVNPENNCPLTDFTFEDSEPSIVAERSK